MTLKIMLAHWVPLTPLNDTSKMLIHQCRILEQIQVAPLRKAIVATSVENRLNTLSAIHTIRSDAKKF